MLKIKLHNNLAISYKQQKINDAAPTIVFLHGLMSDKNGSKAIAIEEFCLKNSFNFIAFDNLGHGNSDGIFTDYSIDSWLIATKDFLTKFNLENLIIIGSSMGGWLALLLGIQNFQNIKGIILLAPAPDFTQKIWQSFSKLEQDNIRKGEIISIKKDDNFPGIPVSYNLISESENHCLLHRDVLDIKAPIIIIHGMEDKDVDYQLSKKLTDKIKNNFLSLKLLKYSGHRLSSPYDLNVITNSIYELHEFGKNNCRVEI